MFDKAIQFNPESFVAYINKGINKFYDLGVLLNQFKRYEEANKVFDIAI